MILTHIPDSDEVIRAFLAAEDIAMRAEQSLSTAHLLLGMLTFANPVHTLLHDRNIDYSLIAQSALQLESEPPRSVGRLRARARALADSTGHSHALCAHMLIAITRSPDIFAYRVLERTGVPLGTLRNVAMGYVTTAPRAPQRVVAWQKSPAVRAANLGATTSSSTLATITPTPSEKTIPMTRRTRTDAKIVIVGAGNVGLGLALALVQQGHPPHALLIRDASRRASLRQLLGFMPAVGTWHTCLAEADIILACVRDRDIHELGTSWHGRPFKPGVVIAHTSGCLPAQSLGIHATGPHDVHLGSMHPVVACANPRSAAHDLQEAFFVLEGDDTAVHALGYVVDLLGGQWQRLSADPKARYHGAAVMASNLVVGLLHRATREWKSLGISEEIATPALLTLAQGALMHVQRHGFAQGLTGPLVRGDMATIERHLAALPDDARAIYRLLTAELGRVIQASAQDSQTSAPTMRAAPSAPDRP